MIELKTDASKDFFDISSCITYDDVMYNELHDLCVRPGVVVKVIYNSGEFDVIRIVDIEYLDGTIWVDMVNEYECS